MFIDNWNIQTAVWLKEVCYDRSPFNALLSTFLLSAAWHGVHPGYYFTFLTAVPITLAARRVRQTVRPWFQHTSWSRLIYSLITWLCTQIAMSYTVAPFILLGLGPSLQLYRSLGFCLHILPLLLLLILPHKKRLETKGRSVKEPPCDRNYNHLKKEMWRGYPFLTEAEASYKLCFSNYKRSAFVYIHLNLPSSACLESLLDSKSH